MVILAYLEENSEKHLLSVLHMHKDALGWNVVDKKCMDPLVCRYCIALEDVTKPTRQMQHRLNFSIKEVVKAEVLKLLYASISYPIIDSKQVSPTQVVLEQSGTTITPK